MKTDLSDTKNKKSFHVIFERVNELFDGDDRFTKVRVWLMHLGKNYNGSIFEKQYVEEAIPTLGYIPIVGFIEENSLSEDDFSDHRYVITRKNGEKTYTYVGMPYGVILSKEDNNAHFATRLCDDGITREYLVVDGVLWNQFKGAEIMNRDEIKDHSMELFESTIEGFEDDDGWFHFTKFSFQAACILGKDYNPAMEGSTIETKFTMNDFVAEMQREISDKVKNYSLIKSDNDEKGGKSMQEVNEKTDFALTVMEHIEEVSALLGEEQYIDRWGYPSSRYGLVDIQDGEVIAYDRKNNWRKFGIPFTMDGDKVVLNFAACKRKKTMYVDFAEGEANFTEGESANEDVVENAFCKVADYLNEKVTAAESAKETAVTQYTEVKAQFDEMKPKYDEYVNKEQERIDAETKEAKDALFTKFDQHLKDDTRYTELKTKASDMTISDIEAACSIYFAQISLSKFSTNKKNETPNVYGLPEELEDSSLVVSPRYGVIKKTNK